MSQRRLMRAQQLMDSQISLPDKSKLKINENENTDKHTKSSSQVVKKDL